mgnify:CR=1 FL=1
MTIGLDTEPEGEDSREALGKAQAALVGKDIIGSALGRSGLNDLEGITVSKIPVIEVLLTPMPLFEAKVACRVKVKPGNELLEDLDGSIGKKLI